MFGFSNNKRFLIINSNTNNQTICDSSNNYLQKIKIYLNDSPFIYCHGIWLIYLSANNPQTITNTPSTTTTPVLKNNVKDKKKEDNNLLPIIIGSIVGFILLVIIIIILIRWYKKRKLKMAQTTIDTTYIIKSTDKK